MKYSSLSPIINRLKSTTGLLEASLVQIQANTCPDIKELQGAAIEILEAWTELQSEIEETKRLMVRQTEIACPSCEQTLICDCTASAIGRPPK